LKFHHALLAVAATVVPLHASGITLNFEGLLDSEAIDSYYDGGDGGLGSGPGNDYGVTFSPDATAFIQTLIPSGNTYVNGGSGLFGGEPSADTALMFCDPSFCNSGQTAETIDLSGGFNSGLSLYYSAPGSGGQLDIYSGTDGTGADLATLGLPATPAFDSGGDGNCDDYGAASDPGAIACPFVPLSVSFSGTAESVVFTGATDVMFFDDITFDNTGSSTPEPATWLLIGSGLAGIAFYRRMRSVRG
jgi:hypothetical protein